MQFPLKPAMNPIAKIDLEWFLPKNSIWSPIYAFHSNPLGWFIWCIQLEYQEFTSRAPTVDVGYVPNAKYLAHIPHQTGKSAPHQILQML